MNLRFIFGKPPQQWTDSELLQAFRARGEDAFFNILFERHYPLVYTLCLNITADRDDSKDITILVFTKIYDLLQRETPKSFDYWLLALARRECLNHLRAAKRRADQEKKWHEWKKSGENFMENELFRRLIYEEELEQENRFHAAIDALPEAQQLCLRLFVYELKSYQEIADITHYPLPQVKSHLQNARRRLKIQLIGTDNPTKETDDDGQETR